ncbi:MAG: bacteriocin [Ruminococcus sp.]|jgi:bacteriocin-like protein|nr:bacteriocin [Ruminococcus sp.]
MSKAVNDSEILTKLREESKISAKSKTAELSDNQLENVIGGASVHSPIIGCPYGISILDNYAGYCPYNCPNREQLNIYDNGKLIDNCGGCKLLDKAAAPLAPQL